MNSIREDVFRPFLRPGDCLLLTDGKGKRAKYTVTAVRCGHDFTSIEVVPRRFRLSLLLVVTACAAAFALGLAAAIWL